MIYGNGQLLGFDVAARIFEVPAGQRCFDSLLQKA